MLLVTQDADRLFSCELASCLEQKTSTRCIVLKLSGILKKSDDWPTRLAETVEHCLGTDGSMFFLESGDVTVLVANATRKDFTRLLGLLSMRLAPASLQGLAFLYELPMDGETVVSLFTRAQEVRMEVLDTPVKSAEGRPDQFNPNLIHTIGIRRKKRATPDILVVEDDAFLQRLIVGLFTKDFRVMAARSGKDALDLYIQQAPDFVFLDIGLPDMSGHDILTRIHELDPEAYVVMLSGQGDRDNVLLAIEEGAKGFVGKPFTPEKLFSYIQKCPFIQSKQRKAISD